MDHLTRRTFLASLAASIAAGSSPAIAAVPGSPAANLTKIVPLYVHHQCGGLLSFGKPYDDFSDMPEWTWGRYIARDHGGDLDAAAIRYAKREFLNWNDVDFDDLDEQEFMQWLNDPLRFDLRDREADLWLNSEGPVAQAGQLIDMLGIKPDNEYGNGICIDHFPDFGVTVGEKGLERLRSALAARGIQIEIIELADPPLPPIRER